MAEEDKASKTEDPTERRISDARKKGNVANSREVANFAVLLGAAIFIMAILPWSAEHLATRLSNFLARAHVFTLEADAMPVAFRETFMTVAPYVAVPVALFMVMGFVAQISQVGLLFTTEPLTPKLNKISPISGIKRIFSIKQIVEILKGIVKITFVGIIAYYVMRPIVQDPYHYVDQDILFTLHDLHRLLIALIVGVLLMMTAITAIDLVFTRYKYKEDLRMTKQEIKDEHKSTEGDPQVKARIRNLRVQRSRKRMMQAVPTADVVVTNPTHFAVALKYEMEKMAAPRLVAKGQDHLALRIRALAEENDVPLVENPPLARALYAAVDLDQEIPPEHYQAVAEVIGYVMRLKKTFR